MILQAADSCQLSSRASSPLWSVSGFWLFFCQAALLSTNLNLDEVFGLWQFFLLKTPRTHQQVPTVLSLGGFSKRNTKTPPLPSSQHQPPPTADSDVPAPLFSWDFGSSTTFLMGTRSSAAPMCTELHCSGSYSNTSSYSFRGQKGILKCTCFLP